MEAAADLPEDLRASTFHPPTLDMLDELGVVDKVIEQGIVCPIWQYRDTREGVVAEWDLSVLENDTGHPYRVQCEQYKLTRIIVAELQQMDNVEVLFEAKGTGVSQDDETVTLSVETLEGPRELFNCCGWGVQRYSYFAGDRVPRAHFSRIVAVY